MIRLTPQIDLQIHCIACSTHFAANDWAITGMHNIASGTCPSCNKKLHQEIPINAGLFYPGTLDAVTGKRVDNLPFENWYLDGLQKACANKASTPIEFVVKKSRPLERERIAILNTIDQTYGHALFELLNASYYLNRADTDLIILVQKEFSWMVPDGAAQVWIADISFGKANNWNEWLAQRIKDELKDRQNVFLCRSFVQATVMTTKKLHRAVMGGNIIMFNRLGAC